MRGFARPVSKTVAVQRQAKTIGFERFCPALDRLRINVPQTPACYGLAVPETPRAREFMTSVHDHLRRVDAVIWAAIGLVAMAVVGATLLTPLKLELRSFLAPASCVALLAAVGWYYRCLRDEQRLGAISTSAAQIIGFAAVGAPLSYVAATAGFPLQDAFFDKWDHQLHFDWSGMIEF